MGTPIGSIFTEEHKQKISEARRGKIMSEEQKRKIREANKGHGVSEDTKKRISESLKEHFKNNSIWNKGKSFSEETRKKMSLSKKGEPKSEEHKQKISQALVGHKIDSETRNKISETLKKHFKKHPVWNKNKPHLNIREENHYRWKGGCRCTAKRILERNGIDTSYCRICKDKKKTIIHHIDGNIHNNDLGNLAVVCYFCHNAIHGAGTKTRFQKNHPVPASWRKIISIKNSSHPIEDRGF
jgi:hypothetical protein